MAEAPARYGPTLLTTANTPQAIVTAGAAGTWVLLREIIVANETVGPVALTIGIYTSAADAAGRRQWKSKSIQPGDSFDWGGFLELAGGSTPDVLYALCDTTNGATITVGAVQGP